MSHPVDGDSEYQMLSFFDTTNLPQPTNLFHPRTHFFKPFSFASTSITTLHPLLYQYHGGSDKMDTPRELAVVQEQPATPASAGLDDTFNNVLQIGTLLGLPTALITRITPILLQALRKNPRFSRLLVAVIAAAVPAKFILEKAVSLWDYLTRFYSTTIIIQDKDELSTSLKDWVRLQRSLWPPEGPRTCASYDHLRNIGDGRGWDNLSNHNGYLVETKLDTRIFYYKGRLYRYTHMVDQSSPSASSMLSCLGRNDQPLRDAVDAALAGSASTQTNSEVDKTPEIGVYMPDFDDEYWSCSSRSKARSLASVELPQQQKEGLINDRARFLHPITKAKYARLELPHRRGYLLHGPPGNGKSSLAMAIAGHFKLDVYILNLLDPDITDTKLGKFMRRTAGKPALVLIEDIDSAGINRETQGDTTTVDANGATETTTTKGRVSLSGLLNALDGAQAPQGHILIMSSNCPEALDSALKREGRVDVEVEFKNACHAQLRGMFMRFYVEEAEEEEGEAATGASDEPELAVGLTPFPIDKKHNLSLEQLEELAAAFVAVVPEFVVSVAQTQGYLIKRFGEPERAVREAEEWVRGVREKKEGKEGVVVKDGGEVEEVMGLGEVEEVKGDGEGEEMKEGGEVEQVKEGDEAKE